MKIRQKPPFLRRRLGNRLRGLREQAGLNMDDAALRLDLSRTALHRVETGETRATVHVVRSMMDLYDCYVEGLLEQVRDALKPRWFHRYSSANLGYVDVETEAVQVHQYSVLNMPGLLQTEPYIRALFDHHPLPRTVKMLEDDVAVRLIRQRRLTDEDDPLELVVIVEEAALHRRVGDLDVMRHQLEHLAMAAALPTVTLQVLAARDSSHSTVDSGFNLLSFPEDYNPELLYVEYVTGSLHIEEPEAVRVARLMFDRFRTEALSPTDSVALIKKVRAGLDQ